MTRFVAGLLGGLLGALLTASAARAQPLDLTHGGPIDINARDGLYWRQAEQEVIARGDAVAVRGNVTVKGDQLIAWYRKKASADSAPAPGTDPDTSTEGNEIYRLQAEGHVRIYTQTDQAQGDKATYDLDQAVMVMTGRHLKLTTPNDVLTARDDLEYWPQKHMAVARGDAVVVTNDGKRVAADTLVAYTLDTAPPAAQATPVAARPGDDPLASSGKLERVEAFGHVSIRTVTDTVTGDRGVYVPDTGMARLGGNVQVTRGQNQLSGAEADVNMKTGVARLAGPQGGRVNGLVLPNDQSSQALAGDPVAGAANAQGGKGPGPKPSAAGSGRQP